MKANLIVATSLNGIIGKDNKIPWKCSDDMKHFKNTTEGGVVIMGRNTYESIGKALPSRHNIVLTRDAKKYRDERCEGKHRDVTFSDCLKSAVILGCSMGTTFIIGGSQVYELAFALNVVDKVYLTTIKSNLEGDAYFHLDAEWLPTKMIQQTDEYSIEIYERK